ncbi:MAG TPA: hypothetical protein EYQ53_01950 [Candidatus Poseidoniales archaeon]|nr:hypothetical protein [Candidatus Poseidoniales archaeon]HIK77931.1 hypothetical protein [Candidatus Poseidoniales archaeon]
MSETGGRMIDAAMAKAIEDQLYSLQRQQVDRNNPISLPRQDFWIEVNKVLNMHEENLNSILQNEGHSQKAVTLTRRISNIRRAIADLARKRLVTFLHHTVTSNLRGSATDAKAGLTPIDWTRHDTHEREFTDGLKQLIKKFRMNVNWDEMIYGSGNAPIIPVVPAGTTQLDSFVAKPGGLTGSGPPPIELEERTEQAYQEPEMDEEDRIALMDAFPEVNDIPSEPYYQQIEQESPAKNVAPRPMDTGVAWELAPETNNTGAMVKAESDELNENQPNDTTVDEPTEQSDSPANNGLGNTLTRIRIILSQEEPVLTEEGEINLQEGDVHMLDVDTADWLIEAGVAESAAL